MDHKEAHHLRLYVLAALFFIVAAVYIGVLYDTQVNNYDYYYASSVRSIARSETVEAARGNITDRNGKVLVSSRSSYNLTFDASLLEKDEDANESLLRLLQLCQSRGINWVDSLPISRSAPFAYTIDSLDSAARSRFLTYLKDLDEAANALAAYLLEHPALLETTDEEGNRENPADDILADEELDQAGKAQALLEELTSSQLTGAMLEGSGLSATRLIALMRKDFGLSASFSVEEARLVLGVQYEIRSRNLARTDAYVLAEDVDTELISLLNDGDYAGAKITPSSVREYETTYGAHILGYLGKINDSAEKEALGEGYNWNDYVGKDGVEAAFESHLKGTDGTRVVSLNEDGKITGEYYSKEPVPGNTVELTIDLDLQQAAEDAGQYLDNGFGVLVLAGDMRRANILTEMLQKAGVRATAAENIGRLPGPGQCSVTSGGLSAGMEYPTLRLAVLTDTQIMGAGLRRQKRRKKAVGEKIDSCADLAVGDLVVHEQHGIGRFVVLHPENHISMLHILAAQEGVHVLHVDVGAPQGFQHLVQATGHVGDGHAQHRRDGMDIALVLQNGGCLVHIVGNEADDAEIAGLGHRHGPHIDLVPGQHAGHGVQGTGLVLQKDGNLLDTHAAVLLILKSCACR